MDAPPDALPLLTPQTDSVRSRKSLNRRFVAGDLVRVRRGFYVPTELWLEATPPVRFVTCVQAVAARLHRPVFTSRTGVFLRGLPLVGTPSHVDVTTTSQHRIGVQPVMAAYNDAHLARTTELPYLPRTRNHYVEPTGRTDPVLAAGLWSGALTLQLPDLLRQLIPEIGYAESLVLADSLRSGRNLEGRVWDEEAWALLSEGSSVGTHSSLVRRVIRDSTALSESPGESLSRARMTELGFVLPELQKVMTGADGEDYRVDFWWPDLCLAGEFDGRQKYGLSTEAPGILWREKQREDALRARGVGFVRWTWGDVEDLERFGRVLANAGVPRRRRATIRLWAS